MARIWVGDFRLKEIKRAADNLLKNQDDNIYFFEDSAEYNWFSTVAANQFVAELTEKSSVAIMIGFNDCVNSCIWPAFDITSTANNYADIVNNLAKQHTGINFIFCSVNPIEACYPFSGIDNDLISTTNLNAAIAKFNQAIKSRISNSIAYLDTADYLTTTSFNTRDGIRFTQDTAEALINFIVAQTEAVSGGTGFQPRFSAPNHEATSDEVIYWRGDSYQGYNPFDDLSGHQYEKYTGDTLPNCTAYAWGRFYEILGTRPALSTGNAEQWYLNTADGYKRGQTPVLGAICCWQKGATTNVDGTDGAGHVAIVEKINTDGSIVTSESGWNSSSYWWTTTRTNDNGNWGASEGYIFQGFIYCPTTIATPNTDAIKVDKSQVTTHTGITSQEEREINALYIYKYLANCGWTINAVAGLLGNLEHESWINPGVTEIGGTGFGLVQWTPPSKFTNWCDAQNPPLPHDDVDSQLARIEHERYHGVSKENEEYHDKWTHTPTDENGNDMCRCGQYFYRTTDSYKDKYAVTFTPKTLNEFATSTKSPRDLACAFLYNYECPGSICWGASSYSAGAKKTVAQREETRARTRQERGDAAEKWYKFLAPNLLDDVYEAPEEKAVLENLKIDRHTPTSIKASFIAKNSKSCYYTILANTKSESKKQSTSIEHVNDFLNIATFEHNGLKPNSEYTLLAELVANDDSILTAQRTFTTPQDYPSSIKSIELTCDDKLKSVNSKFTLKVTKPEYIGYWEANSGYDLQLVINGKVVKTETVYEIKDISESFTIKEKFNYNCKTGDTIQIGVMTWTKDDNGKSLYNNNSKTAKTSKPICLLNKPVLAYLNTD